MFVLRKNSTIASHVAPAQLAGFPGSTRANFLLSLQDSVLCLAATHGSRRGLPSIAAWALDTERFAALHPVQAGVKDHARHEHGSEQVRQQTEGQRDRETFHRTGAEDEQ